MNCPAKTHLAFSAGLLPSGISADECPLVVNPDRTSALSASSVLKLLPFVPSCAFGRLSLRSRVANLSALPRLIPPFSDWVSLAIRNG